MIDINSKQCCTGSIQDDEIKKAEERGAQEAWDFAYKIVSNDKNNDLASASNLQECFGDAFQYTPFDVIQKYRNYKEARCKYENWKKDKQTIKVGDEVELPYEGRVGVVTHISNSGVTLPVFQVLCDNGTFRVTNYSSIRKTGKVYTELITLLMHGLETRKKMVFI